LSANNPITETIEENDEGNDTESATVGRGYIRSVVAGILASSVVGFFTAVARGWLSVVELIRSQFINIGQVIVEQGGYVGGEFIDLVTLPITLIGELGATAGPLAPLLSALIFAVATVITAAIALAAWRLVVIIT
jgi:hypothetical protein